jgi:flagellar basal body rod protein FlgG
MNRGIQALATSMANSETWLDVNANNLANTGTNGFKRDGLTFQATMQQVSANGGLGQSVNDMATGSVIANPYSTLGELGPMSATGNPLDVALKTPSAMFAVQGPNNQIMYTRDGSFTLDSERNLVTQSGMKVLDTNKNPIQISGPGQISISDSGQVSLTTGGVAKNVGQIGAFTGGVQKLGGNLYSGGNDMVPAENAQFSSGTIEGSNVNAIQSMLDLIKIGRSYELQQKSITQQDELSQKLTTTIG